MSRQLDGTLRESSQTPLSALAAAGTAYAAGDRPAAERLLTLATTLSPRYPTYYGNAWVAIGRILLTARDLATCG